MNLFQLLSKQPFSKTLMADDCEVRSSVVDQTEQWPPSVQCTGLSGSQPSHCAMLQIYWSVCVWHSVQCCTVLYCTLPLRCEGNPSAKHRYTAAQAQVSVASVSGLLIGQWRRNIVIWLADRNTGDTLLVSYPLAPQAGAALLVLACFDILLNIFLLKLKQTPADPTEHACPSLLGKAKLFIFQ